MEKIQMVILMYRNCFQWITAPPATAPSCPVRRHPRATLTLTKIPQRVVILYVWGIFNTFAARILK